MRLDATDLRYVTDDEWRVLTAVETGSRNHEVVPTPLIAQLSRITGGQVNKCLGVLARRSLIARVQGNKYDGYRLTYFGLDHLALHTYSNRKPFPSVSGVGTRIGVGKEGDIYLVQGGGGTGLVENSGGNGDSDDEGTQFTTITTTRRRIPGQPKPQQTLSTRPPQPLILKLHRLGRISFRSIKSKRDYLSPANLKSASWMYMSCLAAKKEWEFMKVLHQSGFPTPRPVDWNRHGIVMGLIDGYPMRQLSTLPSSQIPLLYGKLLTLIVRLAYAGLIHGDFNEFNIMIIEKGEEENQEGDEQDETGGFAKPKLEEMGLMGEVEPIVIDFPQMVSTRHENAESLFDRDVTCIRRFFRKRFRFESDDYPTFKEVSRDIALAEKRRLARQERELRGEFDQTAAEEQEEDEEEEEFELMRLDEVVEASGFGRGLQKQLEQYMTDVADAPGEGSGGEEELRGEDSGQDEDSEAEEDSEEEENDSEEESGSESGSEEEEEEEDKDELADQVGELGLSQPTASASPFPPPPSSISGRSTRTNTTSTSTSTSSTSLRTRISHDITRERIKQEQKHHARKATVSAGKAKGHKFKSSKAALAGAGGDGW